VNRLSAESRHAIPESPAARLRRHVEVVGMTDATVRTAPVPSTHAAASDSFEISIDSGPEYLQTVSFDLPGAAPLVLDEPEPLGSGAGPNPARVLAAAVGGCLGASLTFCLRKSHVEVSGLKTTVRGLLARNDKGRHRVASLSVTLEPVVAASAQERLPRCVSVFEDYCVVTASIRSAIPVDVRVLPVFTPA
jgi:uncharacterized OsmC-like protein